MIKKNNQKRSNKLKLDFKKITNFTSQLINKGYKNFKKKKKIEEKNELKLREEQVKKEQKRIELKIKEQSKGDDEIKTKEHELKLKERELESKDKEQSTEDDEIKTKKTKTRIKTARTRI